MKHILVVRSSILCLAAALFAAGCGEKLEGYWRRDGTGTARVDGRAETVQVFEHWEFGQDRSDSYAHSVQYFVTATGEEFAERMEAGTFDFRGDTLVLLRDRYWSRPSDSVPNLPGAQNLKPTSPVRIVYSAEVSDTALLLGGCTGAADCAALSGAYRAFDPSTYFDNMEEAHRRRPPSP
jgi:hypothetical protein